MESILTGSMLRKINGESIMIEAGDYIIIERAGKDKKGVYRKGKMSHSGFIGYVAELPSPSNLYRTVVQMSTGKGVCVDIEPDWKYIEHIQGYDPDYRIIEHLYGFDMLMGFAPDFSRGDKTDD